MAAVTIDAGAQNSYYSAGNIGWSARSLFGYRTAIQQLVGASSATLGFSAASTAVAQSFTTSGAIDVAEIRVSLNKIASPTDNVSVEIWSDTGANLPNASISAADNLFNGANISTSKSWLSYLFSTPVSLSASTKYWIVIQRSGATDGVNYYNLSYTSTSAYADGGTSTLNTGVWSAESSASDLAFQILTETPSALYAVTQSTTPELHVWKSTDSGATWNEQDAANNPSVTNANYPFDACDTRSGPYIVTARFTATNTPNAKLFNMSSDTWVTTEHGQTPPTDASNERPIRIACENGFVTAAPGTLVITYTDTTDDADISHRRVTTAAGFWSSEVVVLAASSTEASMVSAVITDKSPIGFSHRFYHDVGSGDFSMRSITGTTHGTETDLDATAADVETEHASATYQIYQASNVDKIVAAYIDADGSIQERTATLEVTSASVTLGTEHAVGTATTTAGRQLSTCEYDGDLYVVANVSGTGITYYIDAGAAGSWDSGTVFKSGLTACTLSQAISIPGMGLAVVYTDNGDVKIDWIAVASVGDTGTVSAGSYSVSGQAVAALAGVLVTVSAGSYAVGGGAVTALEKIIGTVSAGSYAVTGGAVAARSGSLGSVAAGAHVVTGGAVAARSGSLVQIAAGVYVVTGGAIAGLLGDRGTVSAGAYSVLGGAVEARGGSLASVLAGVYVVSGQTVNADPRVLASVLSGSYAVTGGTVAARAGSLASVLSGVYLVAGGSVEARAGILASIAAGAYLVEGQSVGGRAGTVALVVPGEYVVTGQPVVTGDDMVATVQAGNYVVTGGAVSALSGSYADVVAGSYLATGNAVDARSGTVASVLSGVYVVLGGDVFAVAGSLVIVSSGALFVDGQLVTATEGISGDVTAIVLAGSYGVTGGAIVALSGTAGSVEAGSYGVMGQTVDARSGSDADVLTGSYGVTGGQVSSSPGTTALVVPGEYVIEGGLVESRFGTVAIVEGGLYSVLGGSVIATAGGLLGEYVPGGRVGYGLAIGGRVTYLAAGGRKLLGVGAGGRDDDLLPGGRQ